MNARQLGFQSAIVQLAGEAFDRVRNQIFAAGARDFGAVRKQGIRGLRVNLNDEVEVCGRISCIHILDSPISAGYVRLGANLSRMLFATPSVYRCRRFKTKHIPAADKVNIAPLYAHSGNVLGKCLSFAGMDFQSTRWLPLRGGR